jgi:hypothetical protein
MKFNKCINNRKTKQNEHMYRMEDNRIVEKENDWIRDRGSNLGTPNTSLKKRVKQQY